MRPSTVFLFVILACIQLTAYACEPDQIHNGCKIYGASCTCGNGCRTEYIYRTRRSCLNALRGKSSNVCSRMPCLRGICTQTMQDPGFSCKCEGTGFYGQRCEKVGKLIETYVDVLMETTIFQRQTCPTIAVRDLVYPHECIVI